MASLKYLKRGERSQYIGVYHYPDAKPEQRWHSVVSVNGNRQSCGYWPSEREAAKARDLAIIKFNLRQPLQLLKRK